MNCNIQRNRLSHVLPATLAEVDNLFDQFLSSGVTRSAGWRAPAAFWEAGDKLMVELDVPGVKLEDIDITFEKGQLQITVERKAPEGEFKGWYNERGYGKVTRTLNLPDTANPDAIEATLNDGVLRIEIGKHPELQPKRIEVRTNSN